MSEGTGEWREEIAGDDAGKLEALQGFDSPGALFDAHQELTNKNWRDDFAGDDDKFKSTLERFNTPADLGKSFREGQAKLSEGQYDKPPGEGATEDDIKAYREANGIPLESSGYMENLPDGLVVGEDDKEIMGNFMETLHGLNIKPEVGHAIIGWYNNFAEEQQDVIAETDAAQHQECEDALRNTWGSDYRANINLAGAFLEAAFGKEAKDDMMNGRFADGRAFMNSPKVLEGLAMIQRQLDPTTQLTAPGGDAASTLADEISEIETLMRKDRPAYNKDEKMQARLRQLYDIRAKHEQATGKAA